MKSDLSVGSKCNLLDACGERKLGRCESILYRAESVLYRASP